MTLTLSSNPSGVQYLKSQGVSPEYAIVWCGTWTNVNTDGSIWQVDQHVKFCKENGVKPALHFYFWGDPISDTLLTNGDGAKKTQENWWKLGKAIANRLKFHDVDAIIVLETEWNKSGVTPAGPWNKMARDMAWTIKGIAPKVSIVASPGSWSDPVKLYTDYPGILQTSDILGTQLMRALSKDSATSYRNAVDNLIVYFEKVHTAHPTKKLLLTDYVMATSPNGGLELANHNHKRLADNRQKLADMGLIGVILREQKDNRGRPAATNYYGEDEYRMGFAQYEDGTEKPGWRTLLDVTKPPAPTTYTAEQYDALKNQLETTRGELAIVQADLAAMTVAHDKLLHVLVRTREALGVVGEHFISLNKALEEY